MSRLDSFIARMQAQRDCLNFLKPSVDALTGPILEVGLGNGRTYDHLRDLFPGRDIYVFERKVAAHPDCIPPDDRLFLGEAREAIPRAAQKARCNGRAGSIPISAPAIIQPTWRWESGWPPALDALAAPGRLHPRQPAARGGALAAPARPARCAGGAGISCIGSCNPSPSSPPHIPLPRWGRDAMGGERPPSKVWFVHDLTMEDR